jgi:cardiolipin synthase
MHSLSEFLTFYTIGEWVIRLVMLGVIVGQRRPPSSAMAWLMVIFFLPWLGLVLYLLIGSDHLPRRRIEQHARLVKELLALRQRFDGHPSIEHPGLAPESRAAVTLAEKLGHMPILGGNDVELMTRTEDVVDRLVADVDAAEHHVHLLFYIYADDETGRRVAEALARAVERGVTCRVLVDSVGSNGMLKRLGPWMTERGIRLCEALPVGVFRRRMARIDLRNHRKVAVIDGRIAYTGSQNLVNADYGRRDMAWHDMMARLTGPAVLELQAVFLADWYFDTDELLDGDEIFPDPAMVGDTPVQTLPSGPSYPTENYQRMVVAALHAARKRVIVTTPYFVPDEPLMQALEVAVLRGVRVDLIVPQRADRWLVTAASRAYYGELLDSGVNLHLYQPGLLHSKTVTIDDAVGFLGTSNFDIRSFALNFEVNLLLYNQPVTERLRAEQEAYLAASAPVGPDQWHRRPRAQRLFQNAAKLLSPLL